MRDRGWRGRRRRRCRGRRRGRLLCSGGERGLARGFALQPELLELLLDRGRVLAQGGKGKPRQGDEGDRSGAVGSFHRGRRNYCTIEVQASFAQLLGAQGWLTFWELAQLLFMGIIV